MTHSSSPSVVVIGLDAAEVGLVERYMAEGAMPTLASLAARGLMCRLASVADAFAGAVWPSFLYGVHPGKHGYCGGYPIKPGTLDVDPADAGEDAYRPFYAETGDDPPRVVVLDVPKSHADEKARGAFLVAWGAHAARSAAASHPPELFAEVLREVGPYPIPLLAQEDDIHELSYYRDLHRLLLKGVEARQRLHRHFLAREPWDLFITVFGETHIVGHRFWHFMDEAHPWHKVNDPVELKSAIRSVYTAVDAAIADLVEQLRPDTTVLIVSSHGMKANYNALELLPRLLERFSGVERHMSQRPVFDRLLAGSALALRSLVPAAARARIKRGVSGPLRQRLRGAYLKAIWGWDRWPTMRAFCTPSEDNGYIRVNLRGREPDGLVEPGAEYEALLSELTSELLSLTDVETGRPVIASVLRPQEKYPGPAATRMPDLIAHWAPGTPIRGLRSARFGDVVAPTRVQHRSGDHRPTGFLVAAGPTVAPGARPKDAQLLDLAPTILSLLNRPIPPHLDGRILPEIAPERCEAR